jgi:HEAT repeat protein
MATLDYLWSALEDGRIPQALRLAEEMFVQSPHAATNQEEAAQQLARLYREQWRIWPALRFEEEIVPALGPAGETVLEPLRAELDLFHQWHERLEQIALERLAGEFVAAVKADDLKRAALLARSIVDTADHSSERTQRARQIGNLLGGLVSERERARKFVQQLVRCAAELGLDGPGAAAMLEEFDRATVAAFRRENVSASAMRVELTQAIVELGRFLPDRMALHDPRSEEIERFMQLVRAILAVCRTSPRCERYYEATLLFVEFAPKEVSISGAMAGVEQRLYANLGRTARTVASRVLAAAGAAPPVWESYVQFAQNTIWSKRIAPAIVEVLGLLRNPQAVALLMKWFADPKLDVRAEIIAALGAIGNDEAVTQLLDILRADLRQKVVVGDARREAVTAIRALAQAGRTSDAARRSQLMRKVIDILPPDDAELAMRTAIGFLQGPLDGMDRPLLQWAAGVATQALWHVDRPELARQGRAAPLGFRQPLIDLLERLAPFALDTINRVVLEQAKTFCGAYLAVGELFGKLADPATLPVLKQLIFNTFLHDDKPRTVYQRETILEPGTEERSELTRDRVLASLVYAVSRIQSEEADELLADLFEQVRAGRLPRPGRETADVLMQAYMRVGTKRGEAPLGVFPGAQAAQQEDEPAAEVAKPLSPEELALLRDLDARFLVAAKRRTARVAAMAGLANRRTLAAIPRIVRHLADKDPIVAAAAATALVDYGRPPAKAHVLDRLHSELLHALQSGDELLRKKVVEVLARLGPRRSPLKERLEALLTGDRLDPATRKLLAPLLVAPQAAPVRAPGADGEDAPAAGSATARAAKAGPEHVTKLEKRRQYLLARQAWLRSGKKGPEPQPPE